ncbi:thioredoxin-dependent thiol peroxidase [Gilvimarinus sp. DA14]|uniref:thioredoxin-dependent thiol peroxidase n=1 Tax=Gilvimarinus sp. DA14 TaxID=2956798 RepID=UPI0020B844F5|nr:thioredoxin-dependent thiol peroxidase [Gilvimarinus sp. DA14]UTF60534.1 thioredoxin-dependent thiol peroxidase [Gilvimarinus sp. DA14]
MSFPKIGNLAPVFTLQNQRGEKIALKDYRGSKNVVVYFYPKAMTPGCTTQACGIRDTKQELAALDTVVLAISPDPVARLAKFEEKHELNFDLLSDEDHKVAEKYGAWGLKKFMGREFMGVLRTSFFIDKEGRLRHVFDKVKTKSHDQDVLSYLQQNF